MKKIIWIIQAPISIYINIFKFLKQQYPELELIFVLSNKFERVINVKFKKSFNFGVYRLPENSNYFSLLEIPYHLSRIIKFGPVLLKPDFMILRGLKEFLYNQKPDLVISSLYTQPYTKQAAKYCKKTKTPLIIQSQTKEFPTNILFKVIQKVLLQRKKGMFKIAKTIQCWTKDDYIFAKNNFPIKQHSKIILLPAGVDISIFHRELSDKFQKDDNKLMLLMVGRYVYEKNFEHLFKAIKHLKTKTDLNFKLNIAGYGPLEDKVKANIIKYDIEDVAEVIGFITYEDMNKLYSSHDVLILPSYKEPIGMAIPEALACGTPVIVSKACGAKIYVEDKKNGYIINPYDYMDLVNKILEMADEGKRKKFGLYGQELITNNYTIEKTVEKFYKMINS